MGFEGRCPPNLWAVFDIMQWTLMGSPSTRLPVLLTLIVTTGLGLSVAGAQTSSNPHERIRAVLRRISFSPSLGLRSHFCCIRPRRRDAGQEKRCWAFAEGR